MSIGERFQVVDSDSLKLPGSCLICGYGGSSRPYIDLGVQVRRYGRLYFCVYCFRECEKVVDATVTDFVNGDSPEFSTNLLDDAPVNEAPKKRPGRPKSTSNRTTKPDPK